jgi:hypothetical protein
VSELINRWFSRAMQFNGVAACGLRYPDGPVFSRSWDAQFPEATLNELWPRLVPVTETVNGANAEKLEWTFESGLVTAAMHPSGAIFFLLLTNKTGARQSPGIERLLVEFRALRG